MQLTRLGLMGSTDRIPRSQEEDSHTINSADNKRETLHVLITPEKKKQAACRFLPLSSQLEHGCEFIPPKLQINMDYLLRDHP